jgi:hypothetical protein
MGKEERESSLEEMLGLFLKAFRLRILNPRIQNVPKCEAFLSPM